MVKLAEWMGKEIFRKHGIPIPTGQVVRSPDEAEAATRSGRVPLPCVVKAQVLAGGRGKGGAVRFASTPDEAAEATRAILALEFKGEKVREVLLEQKVALLREFYLSITLDRSLRLPILIASAQGGVEVETVSEEAILRLPIHPFVGLVGYEKRRVAATLALTGGAAKSLDALLDRAWEVFESEDAELVEINPLGLVGDGVVALDAKVIIEDDASFRHPEYPRSGTTARPSRRSPGRRGSRSSSSTATSGSSRTERGSRWRPSMCSRSSVDDPGSSWTSAGPTTPRR